MAYETLKLGCAPVSGTIYAGRLDKTNTRWVGDRKDVTDDVINAVADHLLGHAKNGYILEIGAGKFLLTMTPVE